MTTYFAYPRTSDAKINGYLTNHLGANIIEIELPDFMSGFKIVTIDLAADKLGSVKNVPILKLSEQFVAYLAHYVETKEIDVERISNLISRLKKIDHSYQFEVLSQYVNETNS